MGTKNEKSHVPLVVHNLEEKFWKQMVAQESAPDEGSLVPREKQEEEPRRKVIKSLSACQEGIYLFKGKRKKGYTAKRALKSAF